jgi:hypothetical protein
VRQIKDLDDKMKKIKCNKPSQANSLEKGKRRAPDSSSDLDSSDPTGGVLEAQLAELEINCLEMEANSVEQNPIWILDSSATQYVTYNPDIVSDLMTVSHSSPMLTTSGHAHSIAGKGTV